MCPPCLGSCSSTAGLTPWGVFKVGRGVAQRPCQVAASPRLGGPPESPPSLLRASLLSLSSVDRRVGHREQQPPRLCFRVHSLPLLYPGIVGITPQTPKGLLSAGKAFVCQGRPTGRAPECAEPGRPWKESCALTLHPAPGCPVPLSSRTTPPAPLPLRTGPQDPPPPANPRPVQAPTQGAYWQSRGCPGNEHTPKPAPRPPTPGVQEAQSQPPQPCSVQRPENQMWAETALPTCTHLQSRAIFHVLWAILKQVYKTGILIDDILA